MSPKAKRGYSREFTPRTERRVTIQLDRVPPTLKEDFERKARDRGLSTRAALLTLMRLVVEGKVGWTPEDVQEG